MILASGAFFKKKYKRLYIASLLSWIGYLLAEIADTLISGVFLDSNAVAGVEIVAPLYTLLYFLSIMPGVGGAVLYGMEQGAFHTEKTKKIAGLVLILSIGTGIIMCLIMIMAKDIILGFYNCSPEIIEYASKYYNGFIWVALICPVYWGIYYLVLVDGDEKTVLAADTLSCIINLGFSFILIQKIGIAGLSYATFLSICIPVFVLIFHFFKKNNSIHFKAYFDFKDTLSIIKYAAPSSLALLYAAIVDIVFNRIIIDLFGDIYLAAYSVINLVFAITQIGVCVSNSGMPFITQATGEKNNYEIKRVIKYSDKYAFFTAVVCMVIMYLLAPYWPGMLGITDPDVITTTVFSGRVLSLTFIFSGFLFEYMYLYNNTGKISYALCLSTFYMLITPFLIAYPLGKFFSFNAMAIGFALTPGLSILIFIFIMWIEKKSKYLPYMLKDNNVKEYSLDIYLEEDSIVEARNRIGEFLLENDINEKTVNESLIILEESLMLIAHRNKKRVMCQCTALITNNYFRFITKDDGIIFDIKEEEDLTEALRSYLLTSMLETTDEANNGASISFNRNTYIWKLLDKEEIICY